jgi:hypothetical protein
VLERLASSSPSDRLAKALTMLGRVVKTIHILRYLHDSEIAACPTTRGAPAGSYAHFTSCRGYRSARSTPPGRRAARRGLQLGDRAGDVHRASAPKSPRALARRAELLGVRPMSPEHVDQNRIAGEEHECEIGVIKNGEDQIQVVHFQKRML